MFITAVGCLSRYAHLGVVFGLFIFGESGLQKWGILIATWSYGDFLGLDYSAAGKLRRYSDEIY